MTMVKACQGLCLRYKHVLIAKLRHLRCSCQIHGTVSNPRSGVHVKWIKFASVAWMDAEYHSGLVRLRELVLTMRMHCWMAQASCFRYRRHGVDLYTPHSPIHSWNAAMGPSFPWRVSWAPVLLVLTCLHSVAALSVVKVTQAEVNRTIIGWGLQSKCSDWKHLITQTQLLRGRTNKEWQCAICFAAILQFWIVCWHVPLVSTV